MAPRKLAIDREHVSPEVPDLYSNTSRGSVRSLADPNLPDGVRTFSTKLRDCQIEAELEKNVFNGFHFHPIPEEVKSIYINPLIEYIASPAEQPKEVLPVSLDDAEGLLLDHLDRVGNIAAAVTPGVGKTHLAVRKARGEAYESVVIYSFPNHRLAQEWVEKACAMPGGDTPIIHLVGRREQNPCTCHNYEAIKWAAFKGFFPGVVICPTCQHSPMSGAKAGICPYYKQFKLIEEQERGLIFCTIAQLNTLLVRDSFKGIARIFIDEQPLPAFLQHEDLVSLDAMQSIKPWLSPAAVELIESIEETAKDLHAVAAMKEGKKAIGRLYTSDPGGGQWKGRKSLWELSRIDESKASDILLREIRALIDMPQRKLFREGVNRNAILWLDAALSESVAWIQVSKNTKRPISFHRLSHQTIPEPTKITLLDATTTVEELRALFGRDFDLLDLKVNWEGRRIWIRQSMGKVGLSRMSEAKLDRHLRLVIEHVAENARRGLLISHMNKEATALRILQELRPNVRWESTHFYAARGLNAFEDSDVVVCFGVPTRSPGAAADLAGALFPDDPVQQGRWMKQQNEAELYQCVHRARFVRNSGRTLIVVGQYWPEDLLGKPDLTEDRRRKGSALAQAAERALKFYDLAGFFTKETAAIVGIGTRRDREKIERLQEELFERMDKLIKEGREVPALLHNVSNRVQEASGRSILLFSDKNAWSNLLTKIEEARPGIGELSTKLPNWGNTWSKGLGSVSAARRLYSEMRGAGQSLGIELPDFEEGAWRQVTPAERNLTA